MSMCRLIISFLLAFTINVSSSDAQIWSNIKEKAGALSNKMRSASQDAWNSDTRKNAWSKTKEASSKALGSHQNTVPVMGRKFINIIPDSKLNSMGESSYKSFMRSATPSKNSVKTAQVKRVAKRLAKAAEELCEENGVQCDFDWEFNLVKNKQINAWCMPGGKIVVYEGILPVAKDDPHKAIPFWGRLQLFLCIIFLLEDVCEFTRINEAIKGDKKPTIQTYFIGLYR